MSQEVIHEIDGVIYHDEIDDATLTAGKQQAEEEKEEEKAQKKTTKKKKTGAQGAQSEPAEPDEVETYVMAHITRVKRDPVTDEEIDKVMEKTRQEEHDIMQAVGEHDKKVRREEMEADGKPEAEIAKMEQEVDAETARKTKTATIFCDEFAAKLHDLKQSTEGESLTLTAEMLSDVPTCIKANCTEVFRNANVVFAEWGDAWEKRQRREDAQEARSYLHDYTRCSESKLKTLVATVVIEQMKKDKKTLLSVDPENLRQRYVSLIKPHIIGRNAKFSAMIEAKWIRTGEKEELCKDIPPEALAEFLLAGDMVARVRVDGKPEHDLLGVRCADPTAVEKYGLYGLIHYKELGSPDTDLADICERVCPGAPDSYKKKVGSILLPRLSGSVRRECFCPGVVPVQDGVFIKHAEDFWDFIQEHGRVLTGRTWTGVPLSDYQDYTLYGWDDPHVRDLIFASKVQTPYGDEPYNPDEAQPEIKDDKCPDGVWRPLDWWTTLYADKSPDERQRLVNLDLAFIATVLDRAVKTETGLMRLNPDNRGSGGKSTIADLVQNILGEENVKAGSIEALMSQFGAGGIGSTWYIICGETTSGSIKGNADLIKAIISQDPVRSEQKGKDEITVRPHCRIEIHTNSFPALPDKTDSWYRRWYCINSAVTFADNEKNFRIKGHHVAQLSVRQYILRKCLHMDIRDFGNAAKWESESMKAAKQNFKTAIDPVRQFLNDTLLDEHDNAIDTKWAVYPYEILYTAYVEYYKRMYGGTSQVVGIEVFKQRAVAWARSVGVWIAESARLNPCSKNHFYGLGEMTTLLVDYEEAFRTNGMLNPYYAASKDDYKRCSLSPSAQAKRYRGGLMRKVVEMPGVAV